MNIAVVVVDNREVAERRAGIKDSEAIGVGRGQGALDISAPYIFSDFGMP